MHALNAKLFVSRDIDCIIFFVLLHLIHHLYLFRALNCVLMELRLSISRVILSYEYLMNGCTHHTL